jgi:MSHA biogenesis protein MshN
MSLINKMLRDLESRRNPTDPRPPKLIYEDLHSPSPVRARRGGGRVLLLVVGTAVLAGGVWLAWDRWGAGTLTASPGGATAPAATTSAKSRISNPVATNQTAAMPQPVEPGRESPPQPSANAFAGSMAAASARAPADPGAAKVEKRLREPTPVEDAESRYRDAVTLVEQGRGAEAVARLRGTLDLDPAHARATELLAGLLLQQGKNDDARKVLEDALARTPSQCALAQLLARMLVQEGQDAKALTVLEGSRAAASNNADYLGFIAVLYQRAADHQNAIAAFQQALAVAPAEGRWWVGLGVSLDADRQTAAATQAFERAVAIGNLEPKLRQYAVQRLKK